LKTDGKAAQVISSVPDLSQQHEHCLSSFGALMLLAGRQKEGHPALKSSATTIPKNLLLGSGLAWNNLSLNNSGMGRLNKNRVCEYHELTMTPAAVILHSVIHSPACRHFMAELFHYS